MISDRVNRHIVDAALYTLPDDLPANQCAASIAMRTHTATRRTRRPCRTCRLAVATAALAAARMFRLNQQFPAQQQVSTRADSLQLPHQLVRMHRNSSDRRVMDCM